MPASSFMSTSFFISFLFIREGCGKVRDLASLLPAELYSATDDSMEVVEKMERGRGSGVKECADSEPAAKETLFQ